MLLTFLAAALAMQTPADPGTEAEVSAFLASLPEYETIDQPAKEDAATAEQRALAEKEHPKQVDAVRLVFRDFTACTAKANNDAVRRALRETALKLTSAQRRELTAFYKSPDYARLKAVTKDGQASDAEAEPVLDDLAKRYPLNEFHAATKQVSSDMTLFGLMFEALDRCDVEKRKGLDRLFD
ncbi:hypothetical protein [Sphingomonas sp. LY160]|uniref:hypothetical protein n=1 Tax=Sphingomonas sp. LY160 TaxID=3095342 RepID=UPI002ADEDEF7|nr:hypothetical protein [Sphingomonas sp. LY160]MEA1072377.1 hypothetical protein [Sphingomonas sp. LY160]